MNQKCRHVGQNKRVPDLYQTYSDVGPPQNISIFTNLKHFGLLLTSLVTIIVKAVSDTIQMSLVKNK